MDIVAFTYVYNESDILPWTLGHMRRQGAQVYVIDNWSTDDTAGVARSCGAMAVERFPSGGPPTWFELGAILRRIEELCAELGPDWALVFGADEVLESPWPGVRLDEALAYVQDKGFSAVDFATACFCPVDDGWTPEQDPRSYFRYWIPGRYQANVRAWRACGQPIRFLDGGHDVAFHGYRRYGTRFIIRHYPFRTQAQAERKVFQERLPRYDPAERQIGWHTHLDHIRPGHSFIQDPADLREYDPATFYDEVQRCPTS